MTTRDNVPQGLITNRGVVIDECNSVTGWSVTSGTAINNAGSFYADKTQSILLSVTTAGSNAQIQKSGLSINMADIESVEFVFKVSDRLKMGDLRLAFYNDSTNYYYCYLPVQATDNVTFHGWYKMRVSLKDFLPSGTPNWNNTITRIGIRSASVAGQTHSVICDRIAYNVKGIPKVLFTYDDGWQSIYDKAFPIHQALGQKATTWIVSNFAQGNDPMYAKKSTLDTLYNAGWDIGNHSKDHNITIGDLPTAQQIDQYKTCRDLLYKWGYFRGADHVCYPAGHFNDGLVEVLKDLGVKTARTTVSDIQATPAENLHKLKCYPLGSTTTRADVMKILQRAMDTGCSVHFMLHRVEDTPIPPIESICYPTAELTWLAGYIKSLGVDVVTISEWYDSLTEPRKRIQ
jgi:peptidoglycan/xylan/chitin deacetylase (PgdA/CDA1 family)